MTKFFKNLFKLILIGTPWYIISNYIKNFIPNYKTKNKSGQEQKDNKHACMKECTEFPTVAALILKWCRPCLRAHLPNLDSGIPTDALGILQFKEVGFTQVSRLGWGPKTH